MHVRMASTSIVRPLLPWLPLPVTPLCVTCISLTTPPEGQLSSQHLSRRSLVPPILTFSPYHTSKMDVAYDHIQEENYKEEEKDAPKEAQKPTGLSSEVQEAYKALSASPWAAKLGGFWGNVRKQVHLRDASWQWHRSGKLTGLLLV